MMNNHKINYVEFPSNDLEKTKAFFNKAFGWSFVNYGKEYIAFTGEGLDGGFYKSNLVSSSEKGAALIVIYADDLEKTEITVRDAGGEICKEIFSFPGGRRFHFLDPNGNEFAVWSQ